MTTRDSKFLPAGPPPEPVQPQTEPEELPYGHPDAPLAERDPDAAFDEVFGCAPELAQPEPVQALIAKPPCPDPLCEDAGQYGCRRCGKPMQPDPKVQALIAQWRKAADRGDITAKESVKAGLKLTGVMTSGMATALRECANELDALVSAPSRPEK